MTATSFVTAAPDPIVPVPDVVASPAAPPTLSLVFVTYGTGPILLRALDSLVRSLVDDQLAYEVVVVDNEHPMVPHRTVRRLLVDTAGVRVVRPGTNLGFGGGANLGVQRARGRVIGLLNPDVELSPGWLTPLLAALEHGAAIAAPVLVEPDGSVQSAGHRLFADGSTAPITDLTGASPPDYASAACWLVGRATFDRLGGFDPVFHPAYYEDVDLALRAREVGGLRVVADSRVVHHRGASTASAVPPDTTPQRLALVAKWPGLAATQPAAPG